MPTTYRIARWEEFFENNRTRELKKLDWVPVPNKHDGDGFSELLDHENGVAHYGAWMLIVQVASKCDMRGTLLRDRARPYDAASLARVTRGNRGIFEEALPRLVQIGWLEKLELEQEQLMEMSQAAAEIPHDVAPRVCAGARVKRTETNEGNGTNGMEENRSEGNESTAVSVGSLALNGQHSSRFFKNGEAKKTGTGTNADDLEELCFSILGKDEMARCGSRWRAKASQDPSKLRRVLLEMRSNEVEGGKIVKRGAYAEDLWKRFA